MHRRTFIATACLLPLAPAAHAALDHGHAGLDALLRRHVAWNAAGTASTVAYRGFAADRAELRRVLDAYQAVTRAEYDAMTREQKFAFLANAYNAFTIELVLTRYPDLKSIKDLGSLIQSPWKKRFFRLLGEERHLDDLEHGLLRAPGAFDEPRVHFVVNCASIGCPALRPEALLAERLDAQLEDSTRRFLRDASRNRYDPRSRRLEVSKIFDWFREDWERGARGIRSREQFLGGYADLLATDPADRQRVRDGAAPLAFLDYDWGLNDRR
ncbi:MAG: DUF547 domain-containing protein [Burkholderiales bacterium]|jgi:hypothetical protein